MAKIFIAPQGANTVAPPAPGPTQPTQPAPGQTQQTPPAPGQTQPTQPTQPTQQTPTTPAPAATTFDLKDLFGIAVALIMSFGLYLLVRLIMPAGVPWWATEVAALIIAGGLLAGFGAGMKNKTGYATSAVIFLGVVFTYFMVVGFSANSGFRVPDKGKSATVLSEGINIFELQPGQRTPWLCFQQGTKHHADVSSMTYEYKIIFSDTDTVSGSKNGKDKETDHALFYVQSHSVKTQIIRIDVEEK